MFSVGTMLNEVTYIDSSQEKFTKFSAVKTMRHRKSV